MNNILKEAESLQNEIIKHRRYIHKLAEVDMELPKTTKYVMDELRKLGYEPKEICQSGVVALVGNRNAKKTFLLRADMDALPIKEETEHEFKSNTGNSHACGHDTHVAMLLGAAKVLKQNEDQLKGQVKLMFQPAEETIRGAKAMVEAGVLENPKVDAGMMIHIFSGMGPKSGTVVIGSGGPAMAGVEIFSINVIGKGCHGANPHQGIDAIHALSKIHTGLHSIQAREINPAATVALTIGKICAGDAPNVIADAGSMEGTLRTFDPDVRKFVKERMIQISESIGKAYRADASVEFSVSCPVTMNDDKLTNDVGKYAVNLFQDGSVIVNSDFFPLSGSEDFAFISAEIPAVVVCLAAGSQEEGYKFPMHHPKVTLDETYLYKGSAMYANTAIEWLKENV